MTLVGASFLHLVARPVSGLSVALTWLCPVRTHRGSLHRCSATMSGSPMSTPEIHRANRWADTVNWWPSTVKLTRP